MSRFFSRRELLAGAMMGALGAPLFPGVHAASRAAPVKIANAGGGLNLTMAQLMREQKFLQSFDLAPEVMDVADGSKILGAVVSGSVDTSIMSGFGQVFPAIERGAAIKILAGGALRPGLALFSAKSHVKSVKDLEGKTVGTGSIGALIYQLTVFLLQKHKVDISKIRFVNIGSSSDIYRAVAAGTVDGGAAEVTIANTAQLHMLEGGNMSIELQEYTFQGAWTSERKIATSRDLLVRTLAAYGKLYRFVQDPASRTAFLRARRTIFPRAADTEHEAMWNYIQTYKPFAVDLILAPERLRYMQQLNVGFKVQKSILPFERVADMSLAADALKLLNR